MSLFLLSFFMLYGALHYYLFTKTQKVLAWGIPGTVALIFFLLLMVLSPYLTYFLQVSGFPPAARTLALAGYTWMGLAFMSFWCFLVLDVYRLLLYLGQFTPFNFSSLALPPRAAFFGSLLFSLAVVVYGSFEAWTIRTERITLRSAKIPRELGRLKIVQITDVHLGLIVREGRLSRILEAVKKAEPDILISSGDLVDGQISDLKGCAALLREVQPRLGKFAITGNHEFYAGLSEALEFTREAGFSILRGEAVTVAGALNIAGVDDPAGQAYGLSRLVPERELLLRLPRDKFTLFLKHRPLVDEGTLGLFDLQMSGHTHQGQIFPFPLLTRIFFKYVGGSFALPGQSFLHVSRGSGTWGPPIRFLAPPEVTVYEIVNAESG